MATHSINEYTDTTDQLGDAINTLSTVCDGHSDRVSHGSTIISRLHEHVNKDAATVYKGHFEMDVLRYGVPPEDALSTLRDEIEDQIGRVDENLIDQIVSVLAEYAAEVDNTNRE